MVSPEMQKLAEERAARMQAARELKEPDRVPFTGLGGDVITRLCQNYCLRVPV